MKIERTRRFLCRRHSRILRSLLTLVPGVLSRILETRLGYSEVARETGSRLFKKAHNAIQHQTDPVSCVTLN